MTTAKFTTILTENSTKADEIKFLEEVAANVSPETYLSDFFKTNLVSWVSEQIRNDFPPDLWDYYQSACRESEKANSNAQKALAQAQELKDREERGVSEIARLSDTLKANNSAAYQKQYELCGEIGKLSGENSDLKDEISSLKQEIIRLKAEIYDLEHK